MSSVIEIAGLSKAFGRTQALAGLDLSVEAGEVHGFLGPNGSGKTTTLRILLGLLRADRGTVRLLGGDPWSQATTLHRRLAYVPGDVALWPNLTGGEVIDLLGRLRGGHDPARRAELLERFELDPTTRARAYSKGNRQKVALVAALASDVELLLLDEPTSGLDPLMEEEFRACIRAERDRGRTVLLSSHILAEAEALCDRVSIIRRGRTVRTGSLDDLRQLTRTAIVAEVERDPAGVRAVPGVTVVSIEAARAEGDPARPVAGEPAGPVVIRLEVEPAALDGALHALAGAGVRSLTSRPPTLEELFLRQYADDPDPVAEPAGPVHP